MDVIASDAGAENVKEEDVFCKRSADTNESYTPARPAQVFALAVDDEIRRTAQKVDGIGK